MLGRASTGKTTHIMNEIKRRMDAGETGMLLIVPEQYSHDAEKQLCAICGDRLSLHAEALSFTRLCNNVLLETGNATRGNLTESGQILAMYRALESVAAGLRVLGIKRMRTEVIERLLETIGEFKSLNITPLALERAAKQTSNPLSDKLYDIALIYEAYDALLQVHGCDAADRLSILADCIYGSSAGTTGHIFFDGFSDFTALELDVIEELMRKKADLTVCLTCDMDDQGEIFKIPQRTVTQFCKLAKDYDLQTTIINHSIKNESRSPELSYIEQFLFTDSPKIYNKQNNAVKLYKAPSRYVECEYAAYEVWKMVRDGYRWRDIGIMARDWEEYSSVCENVFDKYGIPYFAGGKVDILSKPPVAVIDAALEIAAYGYEYKSILRYLKSGLIDITTDQCALIENYVLKWQIRGSLWTKQWIMPPKGYGNVGDDDKKQLNQINMLRQTIIKPLQLLRDGLRGDYDAETKLRALYSFLEDINLQERIITRANEFTVRDQLRLSDEYMQLWDITIGAMDQMFTILGDEKLSAADFRKLFTLALSQNNVGVIPVSLDRTPLGSMAMSRRRDLKCLIILGATDENLPALTKSTGTLSESERMILRKLGTEIPAGMEERLNREMNMLYSTLTLPSEKLILMYSNGEKQRPSFINRRLSEMFNRTEEALLEEEYMLSAEIPYTELVNINIGKGLQLQRNREENQGNGSRETVLSDNDNLSDQKQEDELEQYLTRQSKELSKESARQLYGANFSLSATRADNYYSCPYKYFLRHGLKLEPQLPVAFDAQTAGDFMHYILDSIFTEIKSSTGFTNINTEKCSEMTEHYINKYINDVLLNFEGRNARFIYLFKRFKANVDHVVLDMIKELGKSSFQPLDLELDMRSLSEKERGFIDRVDGYEQEGKLYLRVIDYKTRKNAYSFDLSDILYGRDMQMLIYLFALEKYGSSLYGKEIEPAGVLYVPARDVILNASRSATEAEIEKQRSDDMRRSGLILDKPEVIEAMENSPDKEYLPIKTSKDGSLTGSSLLSSDQFALLSEHVKYMIENAGSNISNGDIKCRPYYKNDNENACNYCDYHTVCGFDEELGDKHRITEKMNTEEIWKHLKSTGKPGDLSD